MIGGPPQNQTTHRRTRNRRSSHRLELAKRVNAKSPVRVFLNKREAKKANK